ncbi:hypothetical protein QX51_07535 [Terrisporobacter othiniensis]|uniref:Uncharacterized protein n=1 Tax=Terrisporobacter othiniensis TaxID=1577792 RepID=A0A0B3VY77_9FIRM|nr:hypothetical protein [Terrisporobacter othiniensis]KHS57664.1 hypothetical protein QX51_07535 [Terrisporobacter othiniensis]
MKNKINGILENALREGKNIKLSSNDYKELIKYLNPIAKKFVRMLCDQGHIKSDIVNIVGSKFMGLRANFKLEKGTLKDLAQVDNIISKLRIKPKLISINGNDIDLFFQPNQVINLKSNNDYIDLVFSFIDYISEYKDLGIKFIGWNLENHQLISNIHNNDSNNSFTEELFNWSECDIYDWSEQLIGI